MRILIIDDDLFILGGLRKVLERDHEVRVADRGELGVKIAEEFEPDVVLVDMLLGWSNGLDTVEQMRSMLPHADIVLMTGWEKPEIIDEALSCGANWVVMKSELALVLWMLAEIEAHRRTAP